MEFGRLAESAFHYMLLSCSGIIDLNLHSYAYFVGLLIQAYSAKAVPRIKNPNVFKKDTTSGKEEFYQIHLAI